MPQDGGVFSQGVQGAKYDDVKVHEDAAIFYQLVEFDDLAVLGDLEPGVPLRQGQILQGHARGFSQNEVPPDAARFPDEPEIRHFRLDVAHGGNDGQRMRESEPGVILIGPDEVDDRGHLGVGVARDVGRVDLVPDSLVKRTKPPRPYT